MKLKELILNIFILSNLLNIAPAAAETEKQNATKEETEELSSYMKRSFGEKAIVAPLSFDDLGDGSAITAFKKERNDNAPFLVNTKIQSANDGANLTFAVFTKCELTDLTQLNERIIRVSGQKIVVYYACSNFSKTPDGYQKFYMVKTKQGIEFVRKNFEQKKYVFVDLEGVIAPFETQGFTKFWNASSGKAL